MTGRPRKVLACLLIALAPAVGVLIAAPAGASTSASVAVAGAARPANLAAATALAKATIRKLDAQYLLSRKAGANAAPDSALTQVTSPNWAGYVDTGATFTTINAYWTEPSVTCSSSATQETALWFGFDGYNNSTIEQVGTLLECLAGSAYHFSWYAMYPTSVYVIVGRTVAAGNLVSGQVSRSGATYNLSLAAGPNVANGFAVTATCSSCANSSAEWIAQAPGTGSTGQYPLAQFGTWTVKGALVATASAVGVISSFPYNVVTMANGSGAVMAQPGPLSCGLACSGSTFSVTWQRSS